jgi:hypothetical protein
MNTLPFLNNDWGWYGVTHDSSSKVTRPATDQNMPAAKAESVYCLRYKLDGLQFDFLQGKEILLFSKTSKPALGPTQPSIPWVSRVKRTGHEVDCSFPSGGEVKNGWSYTSTTLTCLQGVGQGQLNLCISTNTCTILYIVRFSSKIEIMKSLLFISQSRNELNELNLYLIAQYY